MAPQQQLLMMVCDYLGPVAFLFPAALGERGHTQSAIFHLFSLVVHYRGPGMQAQPSPAWMSCPMIHRVLEK